MSGFRIFVRKELWVNVPVAIFFGMVDWHDLRKSLLVNLYQSMAIRSWFSLPIKFTAIGM